jgi:hypothetical protein
VLPSVDVVVSHAGLGTVTAALAHGVALVCHPFGRDQHLNAQRVEAVGAGVAVTSADELADAVQRVLAENGFRTHARQQAERPRLGRPRNMRLHTSTAQLLDHEPPTRRALQHERSITTIESCQPRAHLDTRRGLDLTPARLTRVGVDVVERDLPTMQIEPPTIPIGTSFSSGTTNRASALRT